MAGPTVRQSACSYYTPLVCLVVQTTADDGALPGSALPGLGTPWSAAPAAAATSQ